MGECKSSWLGIKAKNPKARRVSEGPRGICNKYTERLANARPRQSQPVPCRRYSRSWLLRVTVLPCVASCGRILTCILRPRAKRYYNRGLALRELARWSSATRRVSWIEPAGIGSVSTTLSSHRIKASSSSGIRSTAACGSISRSSSSLPGPCSVHAVLHIQGYFVICLWFLGSYRRIYSRLG